ncbi:proton-conducting transporter membrane subunit [Coprothermobacter platensis]|uniref:proton-conducting transporter transmembrane domain-containing protein n=1 Tax=Coprothermobacter platensis TaxID=108819 RepID=UPI00036A20EB|nr:proton-conducting transporter membrane subunit [Coprothermobacter platensis]
MTWQAYQPAALLIGIPLLTAFLMPFINILFKQKKWVPSITAILLSLFELGFGFFVVMPKAMQKPIFVFMSGFKPPLGIALWIDNFGIGLTLLLWFITLASLIYNFSYLHVHDELRFVVLTILMATGATGVSLTNDLFNMYVFLEIASISAYALVNAYRTPETSEASIKYLILGSLATSFVLFALILLYQGTRSLNMWDISQKIGTMPTGTLLLSIASLFVGFGVEGAIWPLNAWLPDAHPAAPASISALLSGAVIKIGVLAMVRFTFIVFHSFLVQIPSFISFMLVIAALTVLVGEISAYRQKDAKRMLAFSSTAQVGYMVLGIFSGNIVGFVGGILHLFGHGISKALAFLLSGDISQQVPDRDLDKAGGTLSGFVTSYANLGSILGLSSMPPFITFFSKLFILIGLIEANSYWAAAVLAIGSIIEACYYGSYLATTSGHAPRWEQLSWRMVGYLLLGVGLITVSFATPFISNFVQGLVKFTADQGVDLQYFGFNISAWLVNNGWMWLCILALFLLSNISVHALGYAGLLVAIGVAVFPRNVATMLGLSYGSTTSTIFLGLIAVSAVVLCMICLSDNVWGRNKVFQMEAVALAFVSVLWLVASQTLLNTLIAWEILSWSGLMMVVGEGKKDIASSYYGWAMCSGIAFMFAVAGQYLGQDWWLLALTIGVLIKLGLFGFHGWMIKVYSEGSPVVGAVFSGILSLGAIIVSYKFGVETSLLMPVLVLAGFQILYGGLIALGKENLREVLAYSSLSNMGFLIIAMFLASKGLQSGTSNMLVTYAPFLFAIAYALFEAILFLASAHQRSNKGRILTFATVIASLASAAMPLTGGFLAKWSVYMSSIYAFSPLLTAVLMVGTILSIAYSARWLMLWFGTTTTAKNGAENASLLIGALAVIGVSFIPVGTSWTGAFFWIVFMTLIISVICLLPLFGKSRREGEVYTGSAIFKPEKATMGFEDLFYPYGFWISKASVHAIEIGYSYLTGFFDFFADVVRSSYTGVINDYATYIVLFFIVAFIVGRGWM